MNILDGSWMSLSQPNLFYQVINNSESRPVQRTTLLDKSANGYLDSMFYTQNKQDERFNDSFRFLNRSNNLNDSSKYLDNSLKLSKGFQPYQQKQQNIELNENARMPVLCIATKIQESEEQKQEQEQEQESIKSSSASEKSQFIINNFKIHKDDSLMTPSQNKKNQTKNIPKNYGKAIITFMQKNIQKIVELFEGDITQNEIILQLKNRKRSINTIKDIRDLWIKSRFAKQFRIISNLFLRKHAFCYIFNSRITNFPSHIKYRSKLREAVTSPQTFVCIKDKQY